MISRLVVVAIGLPVVLGLVWLGGWWLATGVAVAALLALHEFYALARPLRPLVPAGYLGAMLAIVGVRLGGETWLLAGFLATFAFAFLLKGVADTRATATASMSATVMGVAWIAVGLAHLVLIRDLPHSGRLDAFAVLLAIWANDSFAYLGGRLMGRHKLAPRTSPGKTWEGLVVGTLATLFVVFVAYYENRHDAGYPTVWEALVLGGVIAVAGPVGDLFESTLKRDMDVKDTGRLLGGHGGVLDRIDSLLFVAVAAFYTLLALNVA